AKLVHALCMLHNFIRIHDPDDLDEDDINSLQHCHSEAAAATFGGDITAGEREEASARRDRIAKEMWDSYVAYMDSVH
ncbi:hypothetical protein OH76DRAFT_1303985, partial [Lentinus brumalis]